MLPAPPPPSRLVIRWVNPLTPLTRRSAGRGTEASAARAHGGGAVNYNWLPLNDFQKLMRQRKGTSGGDHYFPGSN